MNHIVYYSADKVCIALHLHDALLVQQRPNSWVRPSFQKLSPLVLAVKLIELPHYLALYLALMVSVGEIVLPISGMFSNT